MPAVKETTKDFYREVRKDFEKLASKKEYGVIKYKKDWCLAKVAKKHRRAPSTIENIVFNRV